MGSKNRKPQVHIFLSKWDKLRNKEIREHITKYCPEQNVLEPRLRSRVRPGRLEMEQGTEKE